VKTFELAHLKKKKKKERKHFGHLVTFWFGTFTMLFVPLGVLFTMKTLEDERYIVINACTFPILFLRFCNIIHCMSALSLHKVYRLYDKLLIMVY